MKIKEIESQRRSIVYMVTKLLIKLSPEKTMKNCFEVVAEEFSYGNYRAVSNIYHDLKKDDGSRLDNIKPSKS